MTVRSFVTGYAKFVRLAYKESTARKAFAVVTAVADVAGVLALGGVTLVLADVAKMPVWIPLSVAVAAFVVIVLSVLQGAYILWYNAVAELAARNAAIAEVAPPASRVRFSNLNIRDSGGDGMRVGQGVDIEVNGGEIRQSGGHGINLK
jgi:drug/metabolite transporter (DMT)-like permease